VLVGGNPAPIVGRVSMDSTLVDLTGALDAEPGSDVLIYGRHAGRVVRPEEVARACGTIPYELLVRLGTRVQRIFVTA
jgi:alanine racemase